jgi:ubiquinone/menaquinone biosynthesis C-methylase UbiE
MFSDPEQNIKQCGLKAGDMVADMGAGSGFYSMAAARAVAPNGKVYALEVQKDLLGRIKAEAEKEHVTNIEVVWSNIEKLGGTKIRDHSIDFAIVSNVLFQVEDKNLFALEVKRILNPMTGRILVIDWSESFGGMGPHPDAVFTKARALELFSPQGFVLDRDIDTGAHHYGVILKKSL